MAAAASECEARRLHLWPEAGWVEVLDEEDRPAPPGTPGSLVATCLINPDLPLVRYRVGDAVTLAPAEERCPCGRTLPILRSVEGRLDDVVYTRDGRRLGCLDVVHGGMPVREAQVVQETLDRLRVLYVPAPGFSERTREEMAAEIRGQMGPVEVLFEEVTAVPRGPNGKFRMIVCRVRLEERTAASGAEKMVAA
jgi:phenylacetate-CoA ligase